MAALTRRHMAVVHMAVVHMAVEPLPMAVVDYHQHHQQRFTLILTCNYLQLQYQSYRQYYYYSSLPSQL